MVRATGSDRRVVARNRTGVKSPVPRAPCSGIRLLRINAKRSIGKWLWPLCVGLAWFAAREQRPIGATLWPETSDGIGRTAMLIGPLAGGAAAWVAAQDRRHRVDGLARVLPSRAQCIHHLSRVMGLLLWCWLAYLAFGLYLGTIALREATWGTINLVPVWLGLITIAATTALGYWAGLLVPYMATAPVCALLYFAWLLGMPSFVSASPVQYLSPFPFLGFGQGVLVRHWSAVAWPLTGWLGGLIGVATVAAALRYYRKLYLVASLVAMLAIAFGSAVTLLSLPSRPAWIARDWLPYEPICVRQEVEVCVHPAFRALLSQDCGHRQ